MPLKATLSLSLALLCAIPLLPPTAAEVDKFPLIPPILGRQLIPNGKKAGVVGNRAMPWYRKHLGWYYDLSPWPPGSDNDPAEDGPLAVPMLYGSGKNGEQDREWFFQFGIARRRRVPAYVLAMRRPERNTTLLPKGISPFKAAALWRKFIYPLRNRGSWAGTPSIAAQSDDDFWMREFRDNWIKGDWDFTAIHIYQPDTTRIREFIDHYWHWYGKMIWVTEFGCAQDPSRLMSYPKSPCDDQDYVNDLIRKMVDILEDDDRVGAYAYPDLNEYCDLCATVTPDGSNLTESGKAYLEAISQYY